MKRTPPQLAQKLLNRFLRDDLAEEVTGDLYEKFEKDSKRSLFRAKLTYWYQVFNYLRPFAIRKTKSFPINQFDMFQNYFKIAWRNLSGQLMYSFIKIGGFALGIAACVLIAMFIRDDLSYDKNYPDGDRLYRLVGVFDKDGELLKDVYFPAPMASAIKEDYPEVEAVSRINPVELFGAGANEIRRVDQDQNTFEEGFIYGDPEWINMLGLEMVYGSREAALNTPNSILITRRIADKYFPNSEPLGKIFIVNDREDRPYTVGGVVENMPATSHIHFEFIITMKGREMWKGEQTDWGASNYHTYVRLREGTDPVDLQKKMTKGVLEKYMLPMLIADGVPNPQEMLKNASLEFQPVSDIHLHSAGIKDGLTHGDVRFVWLFGSVAAFILIIACINFINLSTARSANRAKEVGLRKVVGSYRFNLIQQFLTESILFSFLSFAIGILLAALLLPYFNSLAGKSMIFPWTEWWLSPLMVGSMLFIGFVAGVYPALYLSGFKPIQTLKGSLSVGSKSSALRSGLVIFQFTTSIILIIGTFIINRQMGYILNKNVGFEKDQVLLLQGATTLGEKIIPFKQELTRLPDIRSASISDYLPIAGYKRNGNPFWQEGKTKTDQAVSGQYWRVDHDYIKTMGMKIVKGRDFSFDIRSDSQACIINEALAKALGLSDPVGQTITNSSDGSRKFQVIGVVQDFHFESLKEDIGGVCLRIGRSQGVVSVKTGTQDLPATLEAISKLWKEFSPKQPIRYAFLDDRFAAMYADVQRMGRIFTSFAILAIIVACLGLFALSAFMTEQRSKEISIRLVLGATTDSIFSLLTMNFMKLVIVSLVVASPIAWFLMKSWLEDFAYRTEITWDVFLLAGVIAIFIALTTISYQSIRAALRNPATGLRSE